MKTVPLSYVCTIEKGATGIMKAVPGSYPMVTLAEERITHSAYQFDARAVIIPLVSSTGHGHASMKRIHFQEGKFALGSILCALIPKDPNQLDAEYLYQYLSLNKDKLLVPLMRGAANVSLSIKSISGVQIPLHSLAEQTEVLRRIAQVKLLAEEITRQQNLVQKLMQTVLEELLG